MRLIPSVVNAMRDTRQHFGSYRFRDIPTTVWMALFTGWNGLQIISSAVFLFIFINELSLSVFLLSHRYRNPVSTSLLIYTILTILLLYGIFRCLAETRLTDKLMGGGLTRRDKTGLAINLYGYTLQISISILMIVSFFLMIAMLLQYFRTQSIDSALSVLKIVDSTFIMTALIVVSWIFSSIVDFALPFVMRGHSMKYAFERALALMDAHPGRVILLLGLRILLILISLFIVTLAIRGLLFVFYETTTFFAIPRVEFTVFLGIGSYFRNIFVMLAIVMVIMLAGCPVIFPMHVFERFFIRHYFDEVFSKEVHPVHSDANALQVPEVVDDVGPSVANGKNGEADGN